jgi:hypothetical protein
VRDDILAHAPGLAARAGCTAVAAEGDADSVAGAYVFRNGLGETLALPKSDDTVSCRVVSKDGDVRVETAR